MYYATINDAAASERAFAEDCISARLELRSDAELELLAQVLDALIDLGWSASGTQR